MTGRVGTAVFGTGVGLRETVGTNDTVGFKVVGVSDGGNETTDGLYEIEGAKDGTEVAGLILLSGDCDGLIVTLGASEGKREGALDGLGESLGEKLGGFTVVGEHEGGTVGDVDGGQDSKPEGDRLPTDGENVGSDVGDTDPV